LKAGIKESKMGGKGLGLKCAANKRPGRGAATLRVADSPWARQGLQRKSFFADDVRKKDCSGKPGFFAEQKKAPKKQSRFCWRSLNKYLNK
jgi:hypothetical protein